MDGERAFEAFAAALDYPMFIATAARGEELDGCLVGFATQASIDPARFLVCISDKNRTYRLLTETDAMALHVVPETEAGLAELFGGETGDRTDKFSRCSWRTGPAGLPILDACPTWFGGRIVDRIRLGDHVGHLIEPFAGEAGPPAPLLTFSSAREMEPGHEA